jgi:hypothetical protein
MEAEMRWTRFLRAAAAALLATVTAASAQTNSLHGDDIERIVAQDSQLSQKELRQLADERLAREDTDPVATHSVQRRVPTTSGRAERNAAVRTLPREMIQ